MQKQRRRPASNVTGNDIVMVDRAKEFTFYDTLPPEWRELLRNSEVNYRSKDLLDAWLMGLKLGRVRKVLAEQGAAQHESVFPRIYKYVSPYRPARLTRMWDNAK